MKIAKDHEPSFSAFPSVKEGTSVLFLETDKNNPKWFSGKTTTGVDGYFPCEWFTINQTTYEAKALKDYDAKELRVRKGDELEIVLEYGEWILARSTSESGWVPKENFDIEEPN